MYTIYDSKKIKEMMSNISYIQSVLFIFDDDKIYNEYKDINPHHTIFLNFDDIKNLQVALNLNPKFVVINLKFNNYLLLKSLESFKYFETYLFVDSTHTLPYLLNEENIIDFNLNIVVKHTNTISLYDKLDLIIYILLHQDVAEIKNYNFLSALKTIISKDITVLDYLNLLEKYKRIFQLSFTNYELIKNLQISNYTLYIFIKNASLTINKMFDLDNFTINDFYKDIYETKLYFNPKLVLSEILKHFHIIQQNAKFISQVHKILNLFVKEEKIELDIIDLKRFIILKKNYDMLTIFYLFNLI